MKNAFTLACLALLILVPQAVLAQSAGALLRGRITDAQGRVIPGATVMLRGESSMEKIVTSDNDGSYEVTGLANGRYDVEVLANGFAPLKQSTILSNNGTESLDLTLAVGGVTETVTVTAARGERDVLDTPEPLSAVGRQKFEERNLPNVSEALRELPGVSVQRGGPFGAQPLIRGFDGSRILLLVDGIRFNNSRQRTNHTGGGEAVETSLIDISQVESVEVVRGGGSVLYGSDAIGGTLNIITKEAARPTDSGLRVGGEFNSSYYANGPGLRGDGMVSLSNRSFSVSVRQALERYSPYHAGLDGVTPNFLNYFGTGGPGARYITSEFLRDPEVIGTGLTGRNTTLEGRYFISDAQSLRVNYTRRGGYNYGTPNSGNLIPFSRLDRTALTYNGNGFKPWLTQIRASLYGQRVHRNGIEITDTSLPFVAPTNRPVYSYQELITNPRTTGYDAHVVFVPGSRHALTVGSSYFIDRNRDSRLLIQGASNLARSSNAARQLVLDNYDGNSLSEAYRAAHNEPLVPDAKFRNLGLFAQDEYQIFRQLRLIGGIRYDRFRIQSQTTDGFAILGGFLNVPELTLPQNQSFDVRDSAVTGSGGIVYRPIEQLSFTARLGRTFHTPGIYERFNSSPNHAITATSRTVTAPNPELKPETGLNLDFGVRARFSRVSAEFNYFTNTFSNLIASRPVYINNDPAQGQRTITELPAVTPLFVEQRANLARARVQGFEAALEIPFEIRENRLSFFGNLSHQEGENLIARVPLDPVFYPFTPLKSVTGLRWDEPRRNRYFVEYLTRIATKATEFPPNVPNNTFRRYNFGGDEPGYVVHDVRGGYTVRRSERMNVRVTLGLENIGDRFYSETFNLTDAPGMGRTFKLGLNMKFF